MTTTLAPTPTRAYAATAADAPLTPFAFERRAPGPQDVAMDILYCGVCHSDLHTPRATNGATPCTRACPDTRSSAASRRSAIW